MKVGIITQPLRTNYGGILQNYALQQVLKQLGHYPITLDYGCYFSPIRWLLGEFKSKLTGGTHDVEFPRYMRTGQNNLNKFIKDYIIKTKPYKGLPLRNFAHNIDAIIVGSDQVWRPLCNVPEEWLYEMYLRSIININIPKIAYAASFGSQEWEYNTEQTYCCSQYVKQYKAISVREDSGIYLCDTYLGRNAQWVLDPTMLLDETDYLKIKGIENPYKRPTLFAYILDVTKDKLDRIYKVAQRKGFDVLIKGANDDILLSDSIELWLSSIKYAEYVITDSFHGTIFSILFKRKFYVFDDTWRGNARFSSLLKLLGLESRAMSTIKNDEEEGIDWRKIELIRQEKKKQSIRYLQDNL